MKPADYVARLSTADWLRREDTQALWALLGGREGRTRAVGGIVRDTLLGRPRERTDIDFATELLPEEIGRRAGQGGVTLYPTGIDHGTVTLRLGDLVAEVTTLREDVETDGRRAVVRFGTDWARDAGRRDFTLNALYATIDGELFDPLGGLDDCLAGRVRFIGDPGQRIVEDRLRVYRFFRFSASHGGQVLDPAGLAACRAAAGTLGTVSAERIGAEIKKMLALPRIAATLKAMVEAGILGLGPASLRLLHAYERRARRPDLAARLALIIAEAGDRQVQAMWRLSNDDVATARAVLTVAELLRDYQLCEAAYRHPAALADGVEVATVLADWSDAGRAAVTEQLHQLDVPRFPVTGGDLLRLGMQPGPALGAELERLEQLWIGSRFSLDRAGLLAQAQRPAAGQEGA
ncbi:CCA tRNA nucleotidyltransferase [Devosia sp.]|uniref:CCA tRNA nucleotidyltransferase n=1 Tax=Devosia sp. TaxID=1871048 RepID=UPI002EDE02B3